MARDWTSTLWPASFMGVPFYVSRDERPGKRRLVVHELPMRDDAFVQDLGLGAPKFMVEAYQLSDSADADALGLEAVLSKGGIGPLSLPTLGVVMARAEEWKPIFDADKLGYIGWSITFVKDDGGGVLTSVFYEVAEIFAAAEALADVAATVIGALELAGQIGPVVTSAQSGYQTALAMLAVLSTSETMDPDTAAAVNTQVQTLYAASGADFIGGSVNSALGGSLIDLARLIGDGMASDDAARTFGAATDTVPNMGMAGSIAALSPAQPWLGTVAQQATVRNGARLSVALRLAWISAYAEAIGRQTFASREDGINARAQMTERLDIALNEASGAEMVDVYEAIAAMQGRLADYLSRQITTLAPVITLSAANSLPALLWAWRLYADPTRADELVSRNDVTHPLFMPLEFEALQR